MEDKAVIWQEDPNAPNYGRTDYLGIGGADWISYDARSDDNAQTCDRCDTETDDGFLCMDGGDFLCTDCVEIVPAFIGRALDANFHDWVSHQNALVNVRCTIGAAFRDCFRAQYAPGKYLGWVAPMN